MYLKQLRQSGVSLIEVMVAVSIIASMLGVVGFSVQSYVNARANLVNDMKALYLAEEGYEILRALRDDDWTTLSDLTIGSTYYLSVSTTTIATTTTQEIIDGEFYRSFVLDEVYRDGDDDVTVSTTPGATVDPDTLEMTMSVGGPSGTTTLRALLTNLHAS